MAIKVKGLEKKRDWYYFQPPQKGGVKIQRIALKTKDFTKAIEKIDEIKSSGAYQITPERLDMAIETFLKVKKSEGRAPTTIKDYKGKLELAKQRFGTTKVSSISHAMIISWGEWLLTQEGRGGLKISKVTVYSYYQCLRSFFSWCKKVGYTRENPMAKIKQTQPKNTRKKRFLSEDQKDRLIGGETDHVDVHKVVYLGLFTGMRIREILAMPKRWLVEVVAGEWVIEIQEEAWFLPKGKAARSIPVSPTLVSFLHSSEGWEDMKPDSPVVAPQIGFSESNKEDLRYDPKKALKKYCRDHGVQEITYHDMRRSFCTIHLSKGTSIEELSQWTGDDIETLVKHYVGMISSKNVTNIG